MTSLRDVDRIERVLTANAIAGQAVAASRWMGQNMDDADRALSEHEERRLRRIAAAAAIMGTGWAIFIATVIPKIVHRGVGVPAVLTFFGFGFLVYIGLIGRALGKTSLVSPVVIWGSLIAINAFWFLCWFFYVGNIAMALVVASALSFVVLGVVAIRLERRRNRAIQAGFADATDTHVRSGSGR